jgi:hypothetical protein
MGGDGVGGSEMDPPRFSRPGRANLHTTCITSINTDGTIAVPLKNKHGIILNLFFFLTFVVTEEEKISRRDE